MRRRRPALVCAWRTLRSGSAAERIDQGDDPRFHPAGQAASTVGIDGTLEKAVHPNPYKRYDSLSEFLFDLRHPNANYLSPSSTPLIERNPLLCWKCTTIALALAVVVLLAMHK